MRSENLKLLPKFSLNMYKILKLYLKSLNFLKLRAYGVHSVQANTIARHFSKTLVLLKEQLFSKMTLSG